MKTDAAVRLCAFHKTGVPPVWVGPFYVPGCTKCNEKVRDGKTTRDAPNPDIRGVGHAHRAHCGDEAFRAWIARKPRERMNRIAYMKSLKLRET